MSAADAVVFPVEVTVRAWEVDRSGPVPGPASVLETLWLPVIEPSTTWLLRRLGGWALACPQGLTVVLPELSESLGLGWSSGASSSLQRSMRRLTMFGLARLTDRFEVLTMVPAVPERRLVGMSPGLVRSCARSNAPSCGGLGGVDSAAGTRRRCHVAGAVMRRVPATRPAC